MALERIGLHITNGTRLPLVGAHGTPRVVTLVDCSPEYHRQVRQEVGPDCLICARFYQRDQPLGDPEADADRWWARWALQARAIADPNTVILGYCEIPDDLAPPYTRFEVRRIQLLHGAGLRAGVGQWSVGVPDLHIWQIYRPALEAMGPGDVVILHEYWADGSDIGNHWYTARFAHPSVAPHLAGQEIAITECGRDVLHLGGGRTRGAPGWQRTCDAEIFFDELVAYDRLLAQYPQVRGATVYNSGGADPEWAPFDPAPVWGRVVAEYTESAPAVPAKPPAEEVPVATLLPMDGRLMDLAAFRAHLETVDLSWVRRVVIHHTATPDEPTWVKWGGWPYWKLRLREHYSGLGWTAMPHLFAGPDGVGLLWSLGGPGRGVGGGALEEGSLHIEIVGRFTDHLPEGTTLEVATGAAAAILNAAGLGAEALTNHSRVVGGWECPGAQLKAAWGWFAGEVAGARGAGEAPDLEEAIGEAVQAAIVPLNPAAAFEVEGAARGLLPASTEVDVTVGGVAYRAQAYRHPGEREWQQIVYAPVGRWGDLTWFERRN